jgi:hypothetical protein
LTHFIFWDSEAYWSQPVDSQTAMMNWLKGDLVKANANRATVPWVIALAHKTWFMDDTIQCPSGAGCDIWRVIGGQVQGAVHGGLKQALIAHATGAPVFDELLLMHRQHDLAVQPNPLACPRAHLANSRNTCRRSFMILRAALICVSKSAS